MSHLQAVPRHGSEEALARSLSAALKLPYVRLESIDVVADALDAVPPAVVRRHTCLPLGFDGRKLVLAMPNPLDLHAIQDVQFAANRHVAPVVACRSEILSAIDTYYPPEAAPEARSDAPDVPSFTFVPGPYDEGNLDQIDPREAGDGAPSVHLFREIVLDAAAARASDIHIEPSEHELRVRLRVDGVLREYLRLPRWIHPALLSRVKVLAKLDITQQRLPQDGRIRTRTRDRAIDLRVSTLPTQFGEKAVLRLLGSAHAPAIGGLSMSPVEQSVLEEALHQPQGLILVTGPTGSGKSTTLHAMLMARKSSAVNVVTIEDPIEYQIPDITQVQVDANTGLTFASCLRTVLRQDPDVILVGEIRDLETAEVAYQASLTGHLVLTTLHTNDSLAAIDRLFDLGVRPRLITSATSLIIAQRLARRICVNCREPYAPPAPALRRLQIDPGDYEFQRGRGCALCGQTGYSGRVGIFEVLRLTPLLKELVNRHASESKMTRAAAAGHRFLLHDALEKVRQGLTTIEEILRVVRIDRGESTHSPAGLVRTT